MVPMIQEYPPRTFDLKEIFSTIPVAWSINTLQLVQERSPLHTVFRSSPATTCGSAQFDTTPTVNKYICREAR